MRLRVDMAHDRASAIIGRLVGKDRTTVYRWAESEDWESAHIAHQAYRKAGGYETYDEKMEDGKFISHADTMQDAVLAAIQSNNGRIPTVAELSKLTGYPKKEIQAVIARSQEEFLTVNPLMLWGPAVMTTVFEGAMNGNAAQQKLFLQMYFEYAQNNKAGDDAITHTTLLELVQKHTKPGRTNKAAVEEMLAESPDIPDVDARTQDITVYTDTSTPETED